MTMTTDYDNPPLVSVGQGGSQRNYYLDGRGSSEFVTTLVYVLIAIAIAAAAWRPTTETTAGWEARVHSRSAAP